MKGICCITSSVQAINENRKNRTSRVMNPQPICYGPNITFKAHDNDFFLSAEKGHLRCRTCGHDPQYSREGYDTVQYWKPPYKPGEIVYVRETYAYIGPDDLSPGRWLYKASPETYSDYIAETIKWKSGRFMSAAAARTFLKITEVFPQRIQEISEEDVLAEGIEYTKEGPLRWHFHNTKLGVWSNFETAIEAFKLLWDSIYAKPKPVYEKGVLTHYISYPFDDIQEVREYRGKKWIVCGNPWTFAIRFQKTERPE